MRLAAALIAIELWGTGACACAQVIGEVRAALARNDFAAAERTADEWRAAHGITPEWLEAASWIGRGALAAKRLERAESWAEQVRTHSAVLLKTRTLDAERHLPLALGAAIEVHAQARAAQGARSEAVAFLTGEWERYRNTSIATRIRKNINLLSLEGRPAPPLAGTPLPNGRPVLLFFWAHWCPDCKGMAADLARLEARFGPQGLRLLAPTQLYGYVAGGLPAAAAEETRYIEKVRAQYYSGLRDAAFPISGEDFRRYGASTTPTLVLIDGQGVVRLYHPGALSYAQLAPRVAAVLSRH